MIEIDQNQRAVRLMRIDRSRGRDEIGARRGARALITDN